jgi:Sulfotransferase domain
MRRRRWIARLTGRGARGRRAPGARARPRPNAEGGIVVPPSPPACPAGARTAPPDFIGVGVQRCGTSRWFNLIASHPDVVRPSVPKELHYFDQFYRGGFTAQDAARYQQYFPRSAGHKTGEWTPLYMSAPWIPRLLHAAAPDARLLVLLRDPVERYASALQLAVRFARRRGTPLSRDAPLDAFVRGLYHAQLVRLLSCFDRSQVLVLQYERCTLEPASQLERTFRFLDLDDSGFTPNLEDHPQRQPNKPTLDPDALDAYVAAYRDDVVSLIEAFPEIDVGLWPNFAHLADRSPTGASDAG